MQIIIFLTLGPTAFRSLFAGYPGLRRTACISFLTGQFLSAMAAILQATGLVVLGAQISNGRAPGLAGHQNILGLMSGLSICLTLYIIMQCRKKRLISTLVLTINVSSLLLSGSTSAMIATGIGLIVLFYVLRIEARKSILAIAGLSVSLYAFLRFSANQDAIRSPLQRFQQVTGNTEYIGTWDVRVSVYEYALRQIFQNPLFGSGFDDISGQFYHPEDGYVLIHNILIRSWLQGGPALLISIGTIYIMVILAIQKSRRLGINGASCSILSTTLAFALTSAAFQQSYFWLIILTAWAMVENWNSVSKLQLNPNRHMEFRQTSSESNCDHVSFR